MSDLEAAAAATIDEPYVVLAICVIQLLVSKPWLDRYRFGPLEWLWRSLTYMKKQPMRYRVVEVSAE